MNVGEDEEGFGFRTKHVWVVVVVAASELINESMSLCVCLRVKAEYTTMLLRFCALIPLLEQYNYVYINAYNFNRHRKSGGFVQQNQRASHSEPFEKAHMCVCVNKNRLKDLIQLMGECFTTKCIVLFAPVNV